MATEYVETAEDADERSTILEIFAEGEPYVFITTYPDGDGFGVKLETNIGRAGVVRRLLEKTLAAMPEDGDR